VSWISGRLVPALSELGAKAAPILQLFSELWRERVLPAIVSVTSAYQSQLQPSLDLRVPNITSAQLGSYADTRRSCCRVDLLHEHCRRLESAEPGASA